MSVVDPASSEPIENLSIGTIIEVDGSHIIAELHPASQNCQGYTVGRHMQSVNSVPYCESISAAE